MEPKTITPKQYQDMIMKLLKFNHWLWEESREKTEIHKWVSDKTAEAGIIAEVQDFISTIDKSCTWCGGTGRRFKTPYGSDDYPRTYHECGACNGTGIENVLKVKPKEDKQ